MIISEKTHSTWDIDENNGNPHFELKMLKNALYELQTDCLVMITRGADFWQINPPLILSAPRLPRRKLFNKTFGIHMRSMQFEEINLSIANVRSKSCFIRGKNGGAEQKNPHHKIRV